MTTEPRSELAREDQPARSMRQRIGHRLRVLRFGSARTASLKDCVRLFYYAELKRSLVFRGWSSYWPERVLTFSIKVPGNTRFRVHVRDNGSEAATIVEFFSLEERTFPRHLPPLQPKVIYDLGANIGMASLGLAALYPQARLCGFEPLPLNLQVCKLNYQNLRNAQLLPWAVGSRTELTSFECNEDPRGGHLGAVQGNPALQPRGRIEVQVYSIADLVRVQKLDPPEFLKVDVEGAELEVLQGIGDAVHSIKRLFVETHSEALKAQCLDWMQGHGFRLYPSPNPAALWGDRT